MNRSKEVKNMKPIKLVLVFLVLLGASPAFAQQLIAFDINKASFFWEWVQGAGGAVEEFRIRCGPTSGVYNLIFPVVNPAARLQPVKPVVGVIGTYFCVVTAANSFGESAPSNEFSFRVGDIPIAVGNAGVQGQ